MLPTTILMNARMYGCRTSWLPASAKQRTRSESTWEDSCSPSSQFRNSMGWHLLNEPTKWGAMDWQRCTGGWSKDSCDFTLCFIIRNPSWFLCSSRHLNRFVSIQIHIWLVLSTASWECQHRLCLHLWRERPLRWSLKRMGLKRPGGAEFFRLWLLKTIKVICQG